MKPDYKKAEKGRKAFLKKYPKGTIVKTKLSGKQRILTEKRKNQYRSLCTFFEMISKSKAKENLKTLEFFRAYFSPKQLKAASDIFNSAFKATPYNNPYKLANFLDAEKIVQLCQKSTSRLLFDYDGFWMGDDKDLLKWLCEETIYDASTIKKIIEAEGHQYDIETIRRAMKKFSKT